MGAFVDMTGMRFGRLTAVVCVKRSSRKDPHTVWALRCDCGDYTTARAGHLADGLKLSCGCLQRERTGAANRTHGYSRTPTYRVWQNVIRRCHKPGALNYSRYGAKGIKVCAKWRRSFTTFLADMGHRPSLGHSLDRIDNAKGYVPSNCRWATASEQARNRRTNRFIEHAGERLTLTEWAERAGMSGSALSRRLWRGWDMERALSAPLAGMRAS